MPRPQRRPGSSKAYARKAIPAELRHLFNGRWELKESLGTSEPAEVKRRHAAVMARYEALLAAAAAARHRGEHLSLTVREADAICGEWYREDIAARSDNLGTAGAWQQVRDYLSDLFEPVDAGRPDAREFRPDRAILEQTEARLRTQGTLTDPDTVRLVAQRWAMAQWRMAETMLRRLGVSAGVDP